MEANASINDSSRTSKRFNLNEICRACMGSHGKMESIFSHYGLNRKTNYIKEMLMSLAPIEIVEDDGLPSVICSQCLQITQSAFTFKQQCETSDAELRSYLRIQDIDSVKVKEETVCHEVDQTVNPGQMAFGFLEPKIEIQIEDKNGNPQSTVTKNVKNNWKTKKFKFPKTKRHKILDDDNVENIDFEEYVDDETSQPLFPCPECIQCFTEQRDLKRHLKNDHDKQKNINSVFCDICNQVFSQTQTLARHMKIHQENQKNKLCTFCGKCFLRSDDLKRHTRIHTGERPYSCDQCPKRYKQSSELKEHIKSHSTAKHYMCTECGKSLATRNGLYVHMKVHRGEKNHECKICGNKYVTTGELTSHINHIHSFEKPFACTYEGCKRAFVTKLSLETHLRTHTGEKPYKCSICDKFLATASSLHEHKRTHTGEKPKKCTVCGRRLGNSQALKKHMRIHTGERPYQCKLCLEKFICGSTLNTHIKVKHMEKQHQCLICHKLFALGTKLRQHMRLHTDEKPYSCNVCGGCFNQSAKLYHHMKSHDSVKHTIEDNLIVPEPIIESRIIEDIVPTAQISMPHMVISQYV